MENSSLPAPPETRHPLGLPAGSVRAVLTLLIVTVVITQVVRGHQVETLWTETLLIALAHYFTSRRFINLAPDVMRRLEAEGYVETELHPLYLPRHSIRTIVCLAFVGLTAYLYREHRLLDFRAISILGVVFAYLLGIVARALRMWATKGRHTPTVRGWENFKAVGALLLLTYAAGATLLDRPEFLPPMLRNTTLGLVLFYFGSR